MASAVPYEGGRLGRSVRSRGGKDVLRSPPTKMLSWLPGMIVTCLAFRANRVPIIGASELHH